MAWLLNNSLLLVIFYVFLAGLCFGSFANVLVYRLPLGLSIVKPSSHCPACNHKLGLLDLVPVLSWVFLFRRCRYCKEKISAIYPFVEIICGLLFAAVVWYSPNFSAIPLIVLAFLLLVIAIIDMKTQEIHDILLIIGAVLGLTWVSAAFFLPAVFPGAPVWHDALLGVLAGGLPLFIIDRICLLVLKKDGFGFGDVKLMAMAGLFIGWQLMFFAYFFAFISGAVYAVVMLIARRLQQGTYMAFGPFLCAGILAALWFGQSVTAWFLGLLMI